MYYHPNLLPIVDIMILLLNLVIYYLILRMENIKCLNKTNWKIIYLKNYTILNIIITTLTMLIESNYIMLKLYEIIRIPLHIFYLYIVYKYINELKNNFYNCKISKIDKYVNKFNKFYVLTLLFFIILIIILTLIIILNLSPRHKNII